MKKVAFLIISILFSSICFSKDLDEIEKFSRSLIEIVKSSNVAEFKKINCIKVPCGNIGIEFIFGETETSTKFKEIMSKNDVAFKIAGPYTVEPEYPDSTYIIVFYSTSKSPFNSEGEISMEVGYAELYRSFLQTQVTIVEGKVLFQRVPFYLESHHPYVGDYG